MEKYNKYKGAFLEDEILKLFKSKFTSCEIFSNSYWKSSEGDINNAKKNMFRVPLSNGTIPYEVNARYGAGHVFMKPAVHGKGVIAGGPVRMIMELAGVKNILTKSLGSSNALNIVNATISGLKSLKSLDKI